MSLQRSLVLATDVWGPELLRVAQRADAAGMHRIWTTERPGRDGLLRAAEVALRTESIGVGTGIVFAFTRNPVAMAGAATELDRMSGHRFALGLGTGTRGVRSRWYGESFEHPAHRLSEYADLVRAAMAPRTGDLAFEGDYYRITLPSFEASADSDGPRVPVYGSGLNPFMLRTMAHRCDGVAIHPLAAAQEYLHTVAAPALQQGAARRDGAPGALALWLMVAVDADPARAEAAARRQLAFYFSTPSYRSVADLCGWGDAVAELRSEFTHIGGDWATLGRHLPPDMLDQLCPHGTAHDVAAAVAKLEVDLAEHGIDELVFEPAVIGADRDEVLDSFRNTVESLASPP